MVEKIRPALLLTALIFFATTSHAENWVQTASSEISIGYIDVDSISRLGDVTAYRYVLNFRQRLSPTMSTVYAYQVNCSTKEMLATKMISTSEHFGGGAVISVLDPRTILPGSTDVYSLNYDRILSIPNSIACR